MTLKQQLELALTSLSPFASGEQTLEVAAGAHTLRCDLVALDSLACAFTRLSLNAPSLAGASVDVLKQTAERLSHALPTARAYQPHRNRRATAASCKCARTRRKKIPVARPITNCSSLAPESSASAATPAPPANPANPSPPKSPVKSCYVSPATSPPRWVETRTTARGAGINRQDKWSWYRACSARQDR